ncbi:uncharacterized protein LACBIDRAFT_328451 [Laccaria bicolor S238N-H82]|uniref:Predicted protein n=1 Tax=Laccaria bicolor (strain S238N-H82 / ATCC MYA-4686) TaxID=486041 RepID=B0DEV5_LACBS|nr:uncharacterized protein LACBIDRAFT_328451 [Laccaria bicolor S238N-H82]EDR06612.1 predicted protein [Laccaria bicolor S238N-H82]|eukprot:XP_001882459.1 predicted protein [Laccaria bicolor S238N-H82]
MLACCRAHVLSCPCVVVVAVLMCRAWVVAGVVPVVVRTEEWGGGAYVPLAHDVATSWALSLVLGPLFRAGGVVVISVGIMRCDDMARPQLSLTHTICIACLFPLDWDWTLKSGWQSSGSPVDWTGLDWTGLQWTGHSASQSGLKTQYNFVVPWEYMLEILQLARKFFLFKGINVDDGALCIFGAGCS